jgi:hypothetical protein
MRLTPRVAGFRSEYPAGFKLECMAGFVGTRRKTDGHCYGVMSSTSNRAVNLTTRIFMLLALAMPRAA